MIDDHNTYAAGTDKVALNVRRRIADCLQAHPAIQGPLIDTAEGIKFFGEWMERTDRAGSADLAVRTACSLARNDFPERKLNLLQDPVVKKFLKGLRDRQGDDDNGDTPLPLAMYQWVDNYLSHLKRPMLDSRLRAAGTMGFQGGVRADEFGGTTRGWEAGEHTRIYRDRPRHPVQCHHQEILRRHRCHRHPLHRRRHHCCHRSLRPRRRLRRPIRH